MRRCKSKLMVTLQYHHLPFVHCRAPRVPWAYLRMLLTLVEFVELQSVMVLRTVDKVTWVADRHRLHLPFRQEQSKKGIQLILLARLLSFLFLKQHRDLLFEISPLAT